MKEKLHKVEQYKNKWWRRWYYDDSKRVYVGSSIVAAGAIMALYVYTYYSK